MQALGLEYLRSCLILVSIKYFLDYIRSNENPKKASWILDKIWHYPAIVAQAHPLGGSRLQHCWPVSQFANVDDKNEPLDANSVDP